MRRFASVLTRLDPDADYLNFGVPGYSTDQELLLLDPQVLGYAPDAVWLAFYLGNDLLDNALDYPLQADQAKPRFELLGDGSLVLGNVPVPLEEKGAVARQRTIDEIVYGDSLDAHRALLDRLVGSSHLLGRLVTARGVIDDPELEAVLDARLAQQKRLLGALLAEFATNVRARGAVLVLIPLPGQSVVEQPRSPAAVFQRYVSRFVVSEAERLGIVVADPQAMLRAACGGSELPCFYRNEGHYTAVAHGLIGEFLSDSKRRRAAPGRPS